jgi:hypothetical protein
MNAEVRNTAGDELKSTGFQFGVAASAFIYARSRHS